jgi:hypothetical protein
LAIPSAAIGIFLKEGTISNLKAAVNKVGDNHLSRDIMVGS